MSKDISDTWDYRVVRQITEKGITSAGNGDSRLSVQEVYYDDETGEPMAHSIDLQLEGDNIADLRTTLQRMLWCLDKDVVDEIHSETEKIGEDGHGNDLYIYESPDGGETIYRREAGKRIEENLNMLRTGEKTL